MRGVSGCLLSDKRARRANAHEGPAPGSLAARISARSYAGTVARERARRTKEGGEEPAITKTWHCPLLQNQADREAWVACCSRRFAPVARRIAGDDDLAQDILQESWIRVLEHVGAYRGGPPACAWVRSIVRNCAMELSRKQRLASEELADDGIADPSPDPEAQARQQEMASLLREMVGALPPAYREVCEMRYAREFSTAETAFRLGISPSNVSTRLDRAVKMLRQRLDRRLRPPEPPGSAGR